MALPYAVSSDRQVHSQKKERDNPLLGLFGEQSSSPPLGVVYRSHSNFSHPSLSHFFMRHIKSKVNLSAHAQCLVTVQSLHGQTTLTPPLQEHRVMQGNTAATHKDSPSFATRVWVPPGTPLTGKSEYRASASLVHL